MGKTNFPDCWPYLNERTLQVQPDGIFTGTSLALHSASSYIQRMPQLS